MLCSQSLFNNVQPSEQITLSSKEIICRCGSPVLLMIVMWFSGVVRSNSTFLRAFIIIWPSSWTETNDDSKRFLLERCGISVHFSEIRTIYFSAWKYVTKEDKRYIQSLDHPDLTNVGPPRTNMASIAVHSRSKRKARHDADDARRNTSDESDVGHNHTQVSTDSDADHNKAKRRRKRLTALANCIS